MAPSGTPATARVTFEGDQIPAISSASVSSVGIAVTSASRLAVAGTIRETRLCGLRTHPHGARASKCAEIDPQTARTHGQLKTREME